MTSGLPRRPPGGQLRLPLSQAGRPEPGIEAVTLGHRTVHARFVRNPRARHYVLRVLPDGDLRVTVPRGGNRAEAKAFVRRQASWIAGQRYAAARAASTIRVRGELWPLVVDRVPAGSVLRLGRVAVALRPGESPRAAACRHLRELARREVVARLGQLAARYGLRVRRVSIRGQRTRWGSCSPDGGISLNWRLVQMPDSVRDYVLIHELMHISEPSHGKRFWALVERACPGHRDARRWLEVHEGELL